MGVTSYYDIAQDDYQEAIELQERSMKRWEDKRDNLGKDKKVIIEFAMEQY